MLYLSQTGDGGFILAGITELHGNKDVLVMKTDSAGQTEWARTIGGTDSE